MRPELPPDPVACAKQRLYWRCRSSNDSCDPPNTRPQFDINDVVLLLCDHHRLSCILRQVQPTLTPNPQPPILQGDEQ
jgi:hypothetical protein